MSFLSKKRNLGNGVYIQKDSIPSLVGSTFFCLMELDFSAGPLFDWTSGFGLPGYGLTLQVAAVRGRRCNLNGCLASEVAWLLERLFSRARLAFISSTRCIDLWNSSLRLCWSPPAPESNSRNQTGHRKWRGVSMLNIEGATKKKTGSFCCNFTCLVFAPVLEHRIRLYLSLQHQTLGRIYLYKYIIFTKFYQNTHLMSDWVNEEPL